MPSVVDGFVFLLIFNYVLGGNLANLSPSKIGIGGDLGWGLRFNIDHCHHDRITVSSMMTAL